MKNSLVLLKSLSVKFYGKAGSALQAGFCVNLIILTLVLLAMPAQAQHDKYFFRLIEGRADLSRTSGSTWLALQQIQPVEMQPGDMLKFAGNGKGELMFPDGSVARLKNGAMITLLRYGINMRIGYLWMTVRRGGAMFKVTTPLGSCNVLGTSFDVDVDQFGKTAVRVFSGIVAVRAASDSRNRQLVLQPGMRTLISDNTRVSDKPDRFQTSAIEISLKSEWLDRKFGGATTPVGQSRLPDSVSPAPPADFSDQSQSQSLLPPMRPEIPGQLTLPPSHELISELEQPAAEPERTRIIARQRSGFLEMLREQELARNSVVGGTFIAKDEMIRDQHGSEPGQYYRLNHHINSNDAVDREYYNLRNRMLRVQSQMRQAELQVATLVNQNISTPTQRRKISTLQAQLLDLRGEHQTLINRLRDIQAKKR